MNPDGSSVQGSQIASQGARPPKVFKRRAKVVGLVEVGRVLPDLVVSVVVQALDGRFLEGAVHALDPFAPLRARNN